MQFAAHVLKVRGLRLLLIIYCQVLISPHNQLTLYYWIKTIDTDFHIFDKIEEANDPSDLSSPSMIGKKRPSVGASSCTAKRVTVQNSTLENYFPAFEKGLDTNHESHFQAEKQVMDGGLTDKAIYANNSISVPRDHKEEIDSGKLKRKRPPRARNQGPNVPATETLPKSEMKGVATRKRGRPEGVQTAGKQEREPTVILAWKQWCMFEDEEDGETVGALINKRDERRLLEQCRKVVLQKQKTENAGDF
jgi:hypothetical protein